MDSIQFGVKADGRGFPVLSMGRDGATGYLSRVDKRLHVHARITDDAVVKALASLTPTWDAKASVWRFADGGSMTTTYTAGGFGMVPTIDAYTPPTPKPTQKAARSRGSSVKAAGAKFCGECGTEASGKYCTECGAKQG